MNEPAPSRGGRRGRRDRTAEAAPVRKTDYRRLRNPFPQMNLYSDDQIAAIHDAALTMLEELGMKILLPEARRIFAAGGAQIDESAEMVRIGREMVTAALDSAPRSILCRAARPDRDVLLEPGMLVFQPGAGAPHATDLERGRRPGTGSDFREL
ncbi:MAG: trimethylamine methyltransferase family protein, partial [Rhodobiaceae bacterium]